MPDERALSATNFAIGPEEGAPYKIEFVSQDMFNLPQGTYARYHFRAATGPVPLVGEGVGDGRFGGTSSGRGRVASPPASRRA